MYEIKFDVKFSGGISFKSLIISDRRATVEEVEEADNRDAPRSGTQTDRNYIFILVTVGLEHNSRNYLFKNGLVCGFCIRHLEIRLRKSIGTIFFNKCAQLAERTAKDENGPLNV